MHKLFFYILLAFLLVSPQVGHAIPDDGNRGSGETCDLTEFKNSLMGTESRGDYQVVNGIDATGRYQFMPSTAEGLTSYQNGPAQCKPAGVDDIGLASGRPECNQLQEAMMDEFTMNNRIWMENNCPAAVAAIEAGPSGPNFRGYKVSSSGNRTYGEPCKLSWSGLLAGAHLGGAPGSCNAITNMRDRDDAALSADPPRGGTSIFWYICYHKDLPIPGADCTPQSYPVTDYTVDGWDGRAPPPARADLNYLSDYLKTYWVGGLQLMTNQLSAVMMQQVQAVGKFFDVKHQLETQRIMQTKFAQAHKDYHPSEQICEIGTFSRALLNSEQRARLTKAAITEKMMTRGLSSGDGTTTTGNQSDRKTRLTQFIETFCSTEDNARSNTLLCGNTSGDADQQNIDIDFTRLIDSPLTLDIDLTQSGAEDPDNPTPAEEREEKTEMNVFAFLNYIFLHDTIPVTGREKTTMEKFVVPYQDARALMAMRSVAHNSFAELIAMKSSGPKIPTSGTGQESNSPYLKALMIELGMEPAEVEEFIGDNPSYYAQMEILTKKIYQNPEFVANLYDKPANVRRIRAAMTAIKLMQDRDIHEALMRREMLISMILELQLRQKQDVLSDDINSVVGAPTLKGRSLTSY